MVKKELSSIEAFDLWKEFEKEIGSNEMKKCYGSYWPRQVVYQERVWAVFDFFENKIGWVSLRPDVVDPFVWLNMGIFPEFTGKGMSSIIYKQFLKVAFTEWKNAEAVFNEVSKSHEQYLKWTLNAVGNPENNKICIGEINFPSPGYVIFCTKKTDSIMI